MKKFLAIVLVLSLGAFCAIGCTPANKKKTEPAKKPAATGTEKPGETKPAETKPAETKPGETKPETK